MAWEEGRGCQSYLAVAVVLVLCALAPSLTCFSLQGLGEDIEQKKGIEEATVMEVRTGSILFDGKALDSQLRSASAAATRAHGVVNADFDHLDGTAMSEQKSQLEHTIAKEAAWRHLKLHLHCGQMAMKLKAMGPRALDIRLDMGDARPLPLIQVPESCGYSVKQNALGLVLVVPYSGCNVIQENGSYMLPMRWLETPVKFTCPIPTGSATTPLGTPKPAHRTWTLPLPHGLNRQKRHIVQPSSYDPRLVYYYNWLNYYYWYMMRMQQTRGTTTAMPSTTMSTAPATERPPPVYYPYYLYYPYYPYYLYPYYPFPNTPVVTTTPPVTTTAPATTEITSTASVTTTGSVSSTTTGSASSTTTMTTTTMPTTSVSTTKTTKPCPHTLEPSTAKYPGQMKPYVSYYDLTFPPYVYFKNKAGNLPGDQNYMYQGGSESGVNARAHPPPYPGFDHWQPFAWFPNAVGQDKPQYGKNLQS